MQSVLITALVPVIWEESRAVAAQPFLTAQLREAGGPWVALCLHCPVPCADH